MDAEPVMRRMPAATDVRPHCRRRARCRCGQVQVGEGDVPALNPARVVEVASRDGLGYRLCGAPIGRQKRALVAESWWAAGQGAPACRTAQPR